MSINIKNLYYLSDLNLVGKLVSSYGVIIHVSNDRFILQDYSTSEDRGCLYTAGCLIEDINQLQVG